MMDPDFVRWLVRDAVNVPEEWSVQGMGMLRRYLPVGGEGHTRRLHIWDSRLKVPNVSMLHTHPWDMNSEVHAGMIRNLRYGEDPDGSTYWRQDLRPGEGGGLLADPVLVNLALCQEDFVYPGEQYMQFKEEIHESCYDDGTITIVDRWVAPDDDPDHAYTFWPGIDGPDGWVSAEPRPATMLEIVAVTERALTLWRLR